MHSVVITIPPPSALLFVAAGVLVFVLYATLKGQGSARAKLARVGVGAVLVGGLLLLVYRPHYIHITPQGISSNSGGSIEIGWGEVEHAAYVSDLRSSGYRLAGKIKGVSVQGYQVGEFHTKSKKKARVVSQQNETALVITTAKELYEFSPHQVAKMTRAVARYVPVTGWPPPAAAASPPSNTAAAPQKD